MRELLWQGSVRLDSDFVVGEDDSLTIRPGARVLAGPRALLRVRGRLTAQGAPGGGEIAFGAEGSWGGIVVEGRGRLSLSCARLKGAEGALRCAGQARAWLSSVEVLESRYVGILAEGDARLLVQDSLVALCETGLALREAAAAELRACRLMVNENCGANVLMASRLLAHGCRFEGNHTGLSVRDLARADVRGSVLRRHHVGVYARDRAALNAVGNRFEDNGQEIELLDEARVGADTAETPRHFEPFPALGVAA